MSSATLALDDVRACIASVAPLELKGMGLLREQPRFIAGVASVPRAQIVEAVSEIVAYTGRCTAAACSLTALTPIPLMNAVVWEVSV